MTRPETLVRQLTSAVVSRLQSEQVALRSRSFPPPPVTPEVRLVWRQYRAAKRHTATLEARLKRLGAKTYTSSGRPVMEHQTDPRAALTSALHRRIAHAQALRDAAMLAVLGLEAARARPIVLQLKRDLEKV